LTSPQVQASGGARSKTLVVLQPGYLPWLGFFDQMRRSDIFVYYDDVQFDKHGWRNRNQIKVPGGPQWLTVPILHHGQGRPLIKDTLIDRTSDWPRKHIGTLRQYYAKAPYLRRYLPELEELINRPWTHVVDLDIAVAAVMAAWLKLEPNIVRASALGVGGTQSERLLNLCMHFGATTYLSGSAARDYLDTAPFAAHGVGVVWQDYQHPVYPQQHAPFVPYLSAIDLLLNCGDDSASILKGTQTS
jgi:hypothetical protein